jgi:ubiquinone/menaquinone biosynthesis C-methylase UbiE
MFNALNQIPHQTYIALDISKEMLLHHPKGAKQLVADLEKKIPLESETFDFAVCFFTLEHIEHLDNFFTETFRILRPEGRVFIGHFFQRRAFEWTVRHQNFKIQYYKRSTQELQKAAESAFFQTEILPLYDKSDHTGDLLLCSK